MPSRSLQFFSAMGQGRWPKTDVDDLAIGVFVEVDSRLGGQAADFLVEVHEEVYS